MGLEPGPSEEMTTWAAGSEIGEGLRLDEVAVPAEVGRCGKSNRNRITPRRLV